MPTLYTCTTESGSCHNGVGSSITTFRVLVLVFFFFLGISIIRFSKNKKIYCMFDASMLSIFLLPITMPNRKKDLHTLR